MNKFIKISESDNLKSTWAQPIKNGSILYIGKNFKITFKTDQHFNWFQKLMWQWCFSIRVEDYNEE